MRISTIKYLLHVPAGGLLRALAMMSDLGNDKRSEGVRYH